MHSKIAANTQQDNRKHSTIDEQIAVEIDRIRFTILKIRGNVQKERK